VLRRRENGDCIMLTPTGCSLALLDRPLICRLHPFDYRRDGVVGLEIDCPIAQGADSMRILLSMHMDLTAATAWIRQLYSELDADKAAEVAVPLAG
jgi:Fe-S-cluster containining protein